MKFSKLLKRYQELLVDAIKMFANESLYAIFRILQPKTEIDALLSEDQIRLHHLHTEGWEAIVPDNLLEEEGRFV